MTYGLASCLDAAPQTPYSVYTNYKKSFMPSTRHCTWPFRHGKGIRSCNYTYNLMGSSQAWRWGVAHTGHVKIPEAECALVATCAERRVQCKIGCSQKLLSEPPTVHHGSGSFLARVSYRMSLGKPVCRWSDHHCWIARGNERETDLLED